MVGKADLLEGGAANGDFCLRHITFEMPSKDTSEDDSTRSWR